MAMNSNKKMHIDINIILYISTLAGFSQETGESSIARSLAMHFNAEGLSGTRILYRRYLMHCQTRRVE